jgi:Tol biopolymer transport system component
MSRTLILAALIAAVLPATASAAPLPFGASTKVPLFDAGGNAPAWSPDGTRIAYDNWSSIFVVKRDGSDAQPLPLTGSPHFHEPAFSPDGTQIAYYMHPDAIQVADVDGSDQVTIANGRSPAWSPDGSRIVYAGFDNRLHVVDADGTDDAPVGGAAGIQSQPAWSPDGGTIAYAYQPAAHASPGVRLIEADGDDDRPLPAPPESMYGSDPTWSPDGRHLAFVGARRPTATTGVYVSDTTTPTWVAVQPAGGPPSSFYSSPAWSPDGDTIAYANTDAVARRIELLELDYALRASGTSIDAVERSDFTGVVATFTDADPDGTVADHSATVAWGDGTTSVGTVGAGFTVTASHRYAAAGTYAVKVTIKDRRGAGAVADATAVVRHAGPPPPPGPVGVSINRGAQFTNTPNVRMWLVWPRGTTELLASNDGGFVPARAFAPEPSIRWRLDSSGPERLPKTLYVRFGDDTRTFQDDIILDETRPRVRTATMTGTHRVSLRAHDAVSGVAKVQLARNRARPGRTVRYRRSLRVASRPRWVRVQDRAGNRSAWRRVTR